MAFNGSGTFNRIYNWVTDKANGFKITASRMDGEFDGIATGLSQCITKDGQTTITANIPLNNYKLTGAGNGTARTDVINVGQVQDNQFQYLGTTGGTADAYTLSPSPSITAYATTQQITAKISATNLTTTPYLQVSAIANPTTTAVIKKLSATKTEIALAIGDLVANGIYQFQRNSANDAWILLTPNIATTTNQGVIEIATNAETAAGTDTERAIVPSALAALFGTSDRSSNGYARLPVKVAGAFVEIIIQWGTASVSSAGTVVTLPIAYTTTNAVVLGSGDVAGQTMVAQSKTTTNFTGFKSGTGSASCSWISIGY